ncbi:MAG: DUF1566 domain-containing protein [Nitrospirales bacterium]|nr:DUF1566 domain-containing protein [Nitrospirales bacterium]
MWERFPAGNFFDWAAAVNHCATLQVGGWKGWALPMREQLASLLDINSILCRGGGLCLPDAHPFQNVQSAGYWSASTTLGTPTFAWMMNFSPSAVPSSRIFTPTASHGVYGTAKPLTDRIDGVWPIIQVDPV